MGGAVSTLRVAGPPANDGPRPFTSVDGRGSVDLARRVVKVRRELPSGLPLTVTVPLDDYRGVSIDVVLTPEGLPISFAVILAHADAGLDLVLDAAPDDTDLVARWRELARDSGLPMLMRMPDGDVQTSQHFGALQVAPFAPRRAPRAFLKRRPNALRRRQVPFTPARSA
jgi:hypothetical protein